MNLSLPLPPTLSYWFYRKEVSTAKVEYGLFVSISSLN